METQTVLIAAAPGAALAILNHVIPSSELAGAALIAGVLGSCILAVATLRGLHDVR